ncbi:hypothetical protein ACFCXR_17490, partial [Streptomyces noursei]|uniref:hypothetical protein n=1 Tax=Streptomyces noursei TaxID=1971 RepID=UPI0035E29FCF
MDAVREGTIGGTPGEPLWRRSPSSGVTSRRKRYLLLGVRHRQIGALIVFQRGEFPGQAGNRPLPGRR